MAVGEKVVDYRGTRQRYGRPGRLGSFLLEPLKPTDVSEGFPRNAFCRCRCRCRCRVNRSVQGRGLSAIGCLPESVWVLLSTAQMMADLCKGRVRSEGTRDGGTVAWLSAVLRTSWKDVLLSDRVHFGVAPDFARSPMVFFFADLGFALFSRKRVKGAQECRHNLFCEVITGRSVW